MTGYFLKFKPLIIRMESYFLLPYHQRLLLSTNPLPRPAGLILQRDSVLLERSGRQHPLALGSLARRHPVGAKLFRQRQRKKVGQRHQQEECHPPGHGHHQRAGMRYHTNT